eukprot:7595783-Pyramimonas_sp.AAC.1
MLEPFQTRTGSAAPLVAELVGRMGRTPCRTSTTAQKSRMITRGMVRQWHAIRELRRRARGRRNDQQNENVQHEEDEDDDGVLLGRPGP